MDRNGLRDQEFITPVVVEVRVEQVQQELVELVAAVRVALLALELLAQQTRVAVAVDQPQAATMQAQMAALV